MIFLGKICVVTGGTRGIGAAICLGLKKQGYTVIANYNQNKDAAQTFSKDHDIPVYAWDVGDAQACEKAVADISQKYGFIDVLVHNAGITEDIFLHKMPLDAWSRVLKTNLDSCFNMTRPLIEGMRQRNFGRIVFISSVNGLRGQLGQTNYCASKAGVVGFAKALALENARRGVTVNVVAPGYINTDMVRHMPGEILDQIITQIPMGRLGNVDEVAHCVNFLIDENSSFITGETLNINGGHLMQ